MNYTWTISALDCAVSQDGLTNVVQNVHWRYRATDADGITAETYGAQSVPSPNPDSFSAYKDLTSEVVAGWLETLMSEPMPVEEGEEVKPTLLEEIQTRLLQNIDLKKNPVTVTLPLPGEVVAE